MEEELFTLKLWRTDWLIKFTLDHLTIQNNNPLWLHNDFKINSIPSNWNFECLFSFLFQILIFWTQAIKNSKSVWKVSFTAIILWECIWKFVYIRPLLAIEWSFNSWLAAWVTHFQRLSSSILAECSPRAKGAMQFDQLYNFSAAYSFQSDLFVL